VAIQGTLRRRLGLADAVVVGAGSMIGAGVFAAWAPAAEAAGSGLLVGLVIAGFVAWCNATSSAQLAAIHPESGGTYVYGRRQLGPAWGHLAGWGFVVGKTASCAAMALAVGAYVWPEQERWVGIAAVVVITLVNIGGLERTAFVTRILLAVSLAALAVVVFAAWSSDATSLERITPVEASPYEMLQSAGLLFFAFAGYARIATLGEEVRDPEVTIPKAIPRALLFVLGVYLVVGISSVSAVPIDVLAATDAPLRAVAEAAGRDALAPLVRVGAAIASLGVLLNLVPGVSRTVLAMARRRELPGWFDHVDHRRDLPLRAESTVVLAVGVLVSLLGLRSAIAISGTAVLTYYAITNASALTLTSEQRRWPRWIAATGLVGCLVLAAALPWRELLTGAIVLVVGAVVRLATSARSRRQP
jgi:basic amino acid/polyamine antiporter, APA family